MKILVGIPVPSPEFKRDLDTEGFAQNLKVKHENWTLAQGLNQFGLKQPEDRPKVSLIWSHYREDLPSSQPMTPKQTLDKT